MVDSVSIPAVRPGEMAYEVPPPDPAVVARLVEAVRARLTVEVQAEQSGTGSPVEAARRDEITETLLAEELEALASAELAAGRPMPTAQTEAAWAKAARDHLFGLGGLQRYLDLPDVENINVHAFDKVFLRLTGNRRERGAWPVAASDAELTELIRTIAARSEENEKRFDRSEPIVDVQLPDGSRMNAIGWVSERPMLSIRVHRHPTASMATMISLGVVDEDLAAFLSAAVKARMNILIAGGPGTGKTTMLRALASQIGPEEDLITIEDNRELNLGADERAHPAVRALQSRPGNIEGEGEITLAALTRAALRGAPDRVIVGEVRGAEVVEMFKAMSQGSDGSMGTIHASESEDVFARLALYAGEGPGGLSLSEANRFVATAVDLIVQLDYLEDGSTRVVSSIREVTGADGEELVTNQVFAPDVSGPAKATGAITDKRARRLERAGLDPRVLVAASTSSLLYSALEPAGFSDTPPGRW
ncbi:CpaF family protein [Catenulispora pinisilvae]|uniref:CpaF family protein n=1 Tax=Catenulispora pinisilvae TaxID=2705253 RepID=UPI001E33E0BF|nr:ATPase, T2SS/T4P/T4SS family [Catenulispora pinisilvae]